MYLVETNDLRVRSLEKPNIVLRIRSFVLQGVELRG